MARTVLSNVQIPVFVLSDLGIGSVLLFCFESVFCFEFVSFVLGLSCCIESVLLYRSRVIPGVLPRTSLACFASVFSFCFESVSARESVMPTDFEWNSSDFHTLVFASAVCQLCQEFQMRWQYLTKNSVFSVP